MSCPHNQANNKEDCLCSIITHDVQTNPDKTGDDDSINIDEIYQVLGREDMLKSSLLDDIDLYLECEDDHLYVVPDIVSTVDISSNGEQTENASRAASKLYPNAPEDGLFSDGICPDVSHGMPAEFNELLSGPSIHLDQVVKDVITSMEKDKITTCKPTSGSSNLLNLPKPDECNEIPNSGVSSPISQMINKVQVSSVHRSIYHKPHLRISFPNQQPYNPTSQLYTCMACEKQFNKKYKLYDHKAKIHNEKHLFRCRLCPYKGTLSLHMKKHILRKHMDVVKQNKIVHQSDKTICKVGSVQEWIEIESFTCNLETNQLERLSVDSKEAKKKYVCENCQKSFDLKRNLQGHTKAVHQERKFECEYKNCDKKYSRLKDLKYHAKVHTNEFQCTFKKCTKTFRDKYNLEQHQRTHTGEKSLSCHKCGYRCIQRSSLNWHMKTKHCDSASNVRIGNKIKHLQ